ncbi:MAG: ribbon-helix-helix protein, CopG family [Actinobacteria bacterium]|nr:ribbon-helix-helix protein, CopG family [Actinomycetota bacterium]
MQSSGEGVKMVVITVRGIDDELAAALRREAGIRGVSVNALVRELLRRSLGFTDSPQLHHDLDALAGAWSSAELEAFTAAGASFAQIDQGLWE